MSRGLSSDIKTAANAALIYPVFLVKLDLDTPICVNSDVQTITYDGNDYLGVGKLGSIGSISEETDLKMTSLDLTLSGIEEAYISTVVGEDYQGKDCTVYIGLFNTTTYALISPAVIFKGPIDNASIDIQEKLATITIRVTNHLSKWDKTNPRRYNEQDQRSRYPTDNAFAYLAQLKNQDMIWGT